MDNTIAEKRQRGRPKSLAPKLSAVDSRLSEPVERQVYRSIRHGLMSGLIAPGRALSGRSPALRLRVSVRPVRDALKRLDADGILDGRPQSSFSLGGMTASEYREITKDEIGTTTCRTVWRKTTAFISRHIARRR
ncbi:GntR family transcriptional regulator [Mesorhizobium sp. CO1-1-8]|nr:GntR family transcriptional regulator [Mesorhizobium sp. CO1-1-8]